MLKIWHHVGVSVVFATARTSSVAASEGGVHKTMTEPFISRGFRGRRQPGATAARLPPGQYETPDFPVLSAGPTPRTPLATWDFLLRGADGPTARWTWDEFQALPHETVNTDIHCVTKWSKLDTMWEGVSLDTLLAEATGRGVKSAPYVLAVSDGGYSTNLPLADVTGGKAWVAMKYQGAPLAPEHGGPARLLVPHLYFWKSAKWVRQLRFMEHDQPGFWESFGYHNYGDPWREQRYSGDP
jgi:DMSO/TMAO reductase YedYZ molybdopterin-dependent catalytic subunit